MAAEILTQSQFDERKLGLITDATSPEMIKTTLRQLKASAQVKYESVQHALDKVEFNENSAQKPEWTETDHKSLLVAIAAHHKQWARLQSHVASRDYAEI